MINLKSVYVSCTAVFSSKTRKIPIFNQIKKKKETKIETNMQQNSAISHCFSSNPKKPKNHDHNSKSDNQNLSNEKR